MKLNDGTMGGRLDSYRPENEDIIDQVGSPTSLLWSTATLLVVWSIASTRYVQYSDKQCYNIDSCGAVIPITISGT
jgi:hypothetical protein